MIMYPYFGGKNAHLDKILPLLDVDANEFVSTHCGSCAVELNRPPAKLETLNDKDEHVYNFLDVLRRRTEELQHHLLMTPWSRREWEKSLGKIELLDELEWARLFYVRVRQSMRSDPTHKRKGWKVSLHANINGGGTNNPPRAWKNSVAEIHKVADRLRMFQLECKDFEYIIRRYDGPKALFFIDPPYVKDARSSNTDRYNHEMTNDQHKALCEQLLGIKGKALLCGYDNAIYEGILVRAGWRKLGLGAQPLPSSSKQVMKEEFVWMNYDPSVEILHLPLFNQEVTA